MQWGLPWYPYSPFAIEKLRKLNFREALGKPGAKPFRQ